MNIGSGIFDSGLRQSKSKIQKVKVCQQFVRIGQYQYTKSEEYRLGGGGCGDVYLGYYADDIKNKSKELAIKVVSLGHNKSEQSQLLMNEIITGQLLKHPNIIKIMDGIVEQDNAYCIMEYANKGNLDQFIKNEGKDLSEYKIREYFSQILQAMKFLRKQQIIHRDIKPSNILLNNDEIKVSDFGVSKYMYNSNDSFIKAMSVKGTLHYIAPEYFRGKYSDKSEIWSLGLTLYYMIMGELPWKFEGNQSDLKKIEQTLIEKKLFEDSIQGEQQIISSETKQLIYKMLAYQECDRISWSELENHPLFQDFEPPAYEDGSCSIDSGSSNQSNGSNEGELVRPLSGYETIDPTNQIDFEQVIIQAGNKFEMAFKNQKKILSLAEKCGKIIMNQIEKAKFFNLIEEELKYLFTKMKISLPKDLYVKSQFLISQRSWLIMTRLTKLVSLQIISNLIPIGEKHILEFYQSDVFYQQRMQIQEQIQKFSTITKDQFEKEYFCLFSKEYIENQEFSSFKHVEDAFLINQSQTLAFLNAFNSVIIDLFKYLYQLLIQTKGSENDIPINEQLRIYKLLFLLIFAISFRQITQDSQLSLEKFDQYNFINFQKWIQNVQNSPLSEDSFQAQLDSSYQFYCKSF